MAEFMTSCDTDQLATLIRGEVDGAEQHAREAVRYALKAGCLLNQAKSEIEHGKFEAWVTDKVPLLSLRTAQAYMRLANRHALMSTDEAQRVALLPLREAMKAIATPSSTPARPERWRGPTEAIRKDLAGRIRASAHSTKKFARGVEIGSVKKVELDRCRKRLMDAVAALDEIESDMARALVGGTNG